MIPFYHFHWSSKILTNLPIPITHLIISSLKIIKKKIQTTKSSNFIVHNIFSAYLHTSLLIQHPLYIRVVRKVRKTLHEYSEFGPNRVKFQKNLQKGPLGRSNSEMHHFLCQIEFHPVLTRLSFFVRASTAATYIFTAPTCTITIIASNLVH
jgi:hypothetical protein